MNDGKKILITRKYPAAGTMEARDRMSVLAAENIIMFYKTGRVPHIVNSEVLAG